jgi:hypothetical protein
MKLSKNKTIEFIIENNSCCELPCDNCYFKIKNEHKCTWQYYTIVKPGLKLETLEETALRKVKEVRAISLLKHILK